MLQTFVIKVDEKIIHIFSVSKIKSNKFSRKKKRKFLFCLNIQQIRYFDHQSAITLVISQIKTSIPSHRQSRRNGRPHDGATTWTATAAAKKLLEQVEQARRFSRRVIPGLFFVQICSVANVFPAQGPSPGPLLRRL